MLICLSIYTSISSIYMDQYLSIFVYQHMYIDRQREVPAKRGTRRCRCPRARTRGAPLPSSEYGTYKTVKALAFG